MKKTVIIQLSLFFLIIIISIIIYLNYFKDNSKNVKNLSNDDKIENNLEDNIIENIVYESTDNKNRTYIIEAMTGILDESNSEIISMRDVNAKVLLKDGNIIYISALKAKYNTLSYETLFEKNVRLNFLDHSVTSDNLDLLFNENILTAYNNLLYKNLNMSINADKIEIDMISKNSKIFNFDEKKVQVKSLN
mgnify:CR=1 FL=1|tara:strand:- start:1506 stop:2081 length:576 start_codon:yes stop_codon:yes gene_type:complete